MIRSVRDDPVAAVERRDEVARKREHRDRLGRRVGAQQHHRVRPAASRCRRAACRSRRRARSPAGSGAGCRDASPRASRPSSARRPPRCSGGSRGRRRRASPPRGDQQPTSDAASARITPSRPQRPRARRRAARLLVAADRREDRAAGSTARAVAVRPFGRPAPRPISSFERCPHLEKRANASRAPALDDRISPLAGCSDRGACRRGSEQATAPLRRRRCPFLAA